MNMCHFFFFKVKECFDLWEQFQRQYIEQWLWLLCHHVSTDYISNRSWIENIICTDYRPVVPRACWNWAVWQFRWSTDGQMDGQKRQQVGGKPPTTWFNPWWKNNVSCCFDGSKNNSPLQCREYKCVTCGHEHEAWKHTRLYR